MDRRLHELFTVLRDNGPELIRRLRTTPYHEHEFRLAWQQLDSTTDPIERARIIFVQLRMAFGGTGSREKIPGFGFAKTSSKANTFARCVEALDHTTNRLRNVTFMCRDGLDLVTRFDDPKTLFYCDPPYTAGSRKSNRDYRHELTDEDHTRLAKALNNAKGKVILSGYDNAIYATYLAGWRTERRTQALQVSRSKGQSRTEVVWMNFHPDGTRILKLKKDKCQTGS
jgi:DNA adenine methylase